MSHAAAMGAQSARLRPILTEAEQADFRAELNTLARWYPQAMGPMVHQAAFLLACRRTCSDALLITAESFRLFAAEFPQPSIAAQAHTLDLARHLEMEAPRRARQCA